LIKKNKPLFIFELANNHNGSLEHGLKIIREIKEICTNYDFDFAFKLQYRDLDTFIHPDFVENKDIKFVKRFSETRINKEEFKIIKDEIKKLGFMAICTPFDEKSVDLILEHNFDVIKIASCSLTDWPLLEKIATCDKPLIASTAGASFEEIDNVVSFFKHRDKEISIMHCVADYPTKPENLQLNQIDMLKSRYLQMQIGYSTHEEPDSLESITIAIAKGASIFEKHVGVKINDKNLNTYSATPEQVDKWLKAAYKAFNACGDVNKRYTISEKEITDLRALKEVFLL
jgi:sialic acid synthase SpsE